MNNLQKTDVVFKIQVFCLEKQFDHLDEYVYSIWRPQEENSFDYNDQFLMILKSNSLSYYWIAIKVPNFRESMEIHGKVVISCQDTLTKEIVLPLKA